MLAVYVSGHGYGHATRTAEVLRVFRERMREFPIVVATAAPAFLFEGTIGPPLSVRSVPTDVGLTQRDALTIDEEGTVAAWRAFMADWAQRVEAEARWLRESGARLVLGDVPPLAFAAAARAGIGSVALTNFSWDWIYEHYAARHPTLGEAAAWAREAYRPCRLLLRLPFAGDLSAFPRIEDVPLVARRPRVGKGEVRRRLGLGERPVVLLSFGGVGVCGLRLSAFGRLAGYELVLTGHEAPARGPLPSNLRRLERASLAAMGLDYVDLVGAADVVVTKPGYGIVTDCIGARTRLVYTERGDFPEYPILVSEMPRYLPAVHVSNQDLREGRLAEALGKVLANAFPEPPRLDGAEVAATRLVDFLR